jgi:hypothetical protein
MFHSFRVTNSWDEAAGVSNVSVFVPEEPEEPEESTLITNLKAYWKLDESSGVRYDQVNSHNMTDVNTVSSTTGKIGTSANFNAANGERLYTASHPDLEFGVDEPFTVSAWVYLTSKSNYRSIVGKAVNESNRQFHLYYHTTLNRYAWLVKLPAGNFNYFYANSFIPPLNTWTFIVAWHDPVANTINIQINDGTIESDPHAGTGSNTAPFHIGSYITNSSQYVWSGRIDEVGFWKRVLTTDERSALYNSGAGLTFPFV